MNAHPESLKEIRDHLVVRGFLVGIHNSQIRLNFRKSLVEAELTIDTVLEKALHLEAVTRIEEKEREPKVAVLQPTKQKHWITPCKTLLNLSLSRDWRSENCGSFLKSNKCRKSSSREKNQSRRFGDRGRRNRGLTGYRESRYRASTPGRSQGRRERSESREKFSKSDREIGFQSDSCWNCGQRGHWAREFKNCLSCRSSQHFKKDCFFLNWRTLMWRWPHIGPPMIRPWLYINASKKKSRAHSSTKKTCTRFVGHFPNINTRHISLSAEIRFSDRKLMHFVCKGTNNLLWEDTPIATIESKTNNQWVNVPDINFNTCSSI